MIVIAQIAAFNFSVQEMGLNKLLFSTFMILLLL